MTGHKVIPDGTLVRVRGLRGTFTFHGPADGGDSCTVYGGPAGRGSWRTVARDRVTVDRKAARRVKADRAGVGA